MLSSSVICSCLLIIFKKIYQIFSLLLNFYPKCTFRPSRCFVYLIFIASIEYVSIMNENLSEYSVSVVFGEMHFS